MDNTIQIATQLNSGILSSMIVYKTYQLSSRTI